MTIEELDDKPTISFCLPPVTAYLLLATIHRTCFS
jgi:hypothetical protein